MALGRRAAAGGRPLEPLALPDRAGHVATVGERLDEGGEAVAGGARVAILAP